MGETPDDEERARRDADELARRDAEELESFRRREEWWRLHYGVPPEEADERVRRAHEQADDTPPADRGD